MQCERLDTHSCDIFIIAGEPSGDFHGAHLVKALLEKNPSLHICGVCGPQMRSLQISGQSIMENLQVMGFTDVLVALPRLFRCFRQIRKEILEKNPRVVVCIDYPGFNIRLERSLRNRGYRGKLIHYICPTVWAWGKSRIPIMAKNLDLLLTILPFEKECFAHTPLCVKYVGHPLIQKIDQHHAMDDFKERYRIDRSKKILSIFPGSRKTEIDRNFSIQLEVARRLEKLSPDIQIAISLSHPQFRSLLTIPNTVLIEPEHRYNLMQNSHLAFAKSGTVTLELALFQIPTLVNFVIRPLDQFIAQKIFRIQLPYYSLPNIIAQKEVFPEFFGSNLTSECFFQESQKLWFDEFLRTNCQTLCKRIRDTIGSKNAVDETAMAIIDAIEV